MLRMSMAAALVVALLLVVRAGARDDKDVSKLVGTWTVSGEEADGTKVAAVKVKGKEVKITREMISCNGKDGKGESAFRYKVDASTTPWKVELTGTEGEHKGKKMHGIAQLDGDNLKICFSKPDEEPPTKFETKEGQRCLVLRRSER